MGTAARLGPVRADFDGRVPGVGVEVAVGLLFPQDCLAFTDFGARDADSRGGFNRG